MPSPAPTLSRVLCATDLSEFGNRAVPFAYAAAAAEGSVTLLHVVRDPPVPSPLVPHYGEPHASDSERRAEQRRAKKQLEALAALAVDASGIQTELRVVHAAEVSEAILAEAERIGADLICMATHSRSGLAQLVLGSSAHEVLHQAGRPVLLVPSPVD
jgi:nucleotide-binding universal stress UspA family protein